MKKYSLFILLSFLLLVSCKPNNSNKSTKGTNTPAIAKEKKGPKTPKTANAGKAKGEKKGAKKERNDGKVKFPKLGFLAAATTPTEYSINGIGESKINSKTVPPYNVTVKGEKLVVTGWAIDKAADKLPSIVFVDIDGKKYRASMGKKNKALEKKFTNTELHNAGFRANIPLEKVSKGAHKLMLYIISADKTTFYKSSEVIDFVLK